MTRSFSAKRLPTPDRQVFIALQALMAAAGLAYMVYAVYRYLTTGAVVGSDFAFFWTAAQVASPQDVAMAYSGDLFSLDAAERLWGASGGQNNWAYPPQAFVLLLPFRGLSYGLAYALWEILNIAALSLATWAAFDRSWRATAFVVLAPAAFFSLWLGQSGMLASALLIAGIGLLERRPLLAGALIGLLTFKPTLGLLIPFALLAGGHWRAILSASLVAGGLILASIALYGLEAWRLYLANIPGFQMGFHATEDNLVVNLATTVFMGARLLGFDSAVGLTAQILVAGCVLATILWAFRGQRDIGLKGALLFVGTALASPFIHVYDISFVTVAVLLLLQAIAAGEARLGERSVALLAWLTPILVFFFNGVVQIPIGPLILALLFGALLRRLLLITDRPMSR